MDLMVERSGVARILPQGIHPSVICCRLKHIVINNIDIAILLYFGNTTLSVLYGIQFVRDRNVIIIITIEVSQY